MYEDSVTGTSNAATYTMTGLPRTPVVAMQFLCGVTDSGTTQSAPGSASIANGSTTVTFGKTVAGAGGFTASGGKACVSLLMVYAF